jgi:hypothetical protein
VGTVRIDKFGGMLPAWDDRFIPDDQASFSRDTYVYSGAAIGWREPKLLRNLTNSAAKYAYRIPTITQGIAGANMVFAGNPNPGDTVTLGEITYTFKSALVNPFDILIGQSTQQTAAAFFYATMLGSFDPLLVAANTAPNPAVTGASAVLGNPTAFVNGTNAPGANILALVKVIPPVTMQLTALNTLPKATSGAAKFKGVVYNSVNHINDTGTAFVDTPSSLIGTGAEVVGCVNGTTLTSTLGVPITLEAGATYWLGFLMDTSVALALQSTGTSAVSQSVTYSAGPPNPFQTTTLSGVTTGGTTVGTLATKYNTNQANWVMWGTMTTFASTDPINTLTSTVVGSAGPYTVIEFQAPEFGAAYNLTPVATVSSLAFWLKDFASFADTTTFFVGGANQTSDTTITGASAWLEFVDQDTNVLRTPVVNDRFQRFYFASPTQPPQYNTYDRIKHSLSSYILGVPAPPITPTLSVTGGGNPTQLGFPTAKTATTYAWPSPGGTNGTLVLYPMQSSTSVQVDDIGIEVATIGGSTTFTFKGMVFADISATDPTQANKPGNLIAIGQVGTLLGSTPPVVPTAVLSAFSTSPVLAPNTQYWIGVLLTGGGGGVTFGMGDTATVGQTALIANGTTFPTDPKTGGVTAPVMTGNFADLQVWADLSAGTAGSAQLETRAYVYTWVTAYDEEGPPSAAALLDGYDNGTWTVGLQPPLAEDMGTLRNIVKTNIYRTMSSVNGGTVFFLVGTIAATATTFIDQVTDDVVSLNLILPSTTWFGPPTTLQGMIAMPNGMFAGFKGNEVWFCEPFRPHAWPANYVLTTDFPIVGLGVVGTTLVAATDTNPQAFTGVSPSGMSQVRIPIPEPCISRGGILSTENGVYYPSLNGLVKVTGAGTATNTTQSWISREKWDKFVPQKFIRAVKNASTYFAFGTTGVTNGQADATVARQGFTLELSEVADKESFSLYPQVGGHRIGLSQLSSPTGGAIDNVLYDPWSGIAMLLVGAALYYYDFTDQAPQITPSLWRSKKFQGHHKDNFSAFRVWFDKPPGGPQSPPPVRSEVPFTSVLAKTAQLAFKPGMLGVVRVIADGFYITERELRYSTELMRIASVQKYTTWQIEIEGVVSVTNIKMATTVKELGQMK